jgi:hypothetical protein
VALLQGRRLPDIYRFHALVTTYEVIISDLEQLRQIDWRVAVIDEAHRLKNRNCKLLQGLSCFDVVCFILVYVFVVASGSKLLCIVVFVGISECPAEQK